MSQVFASSFKLHLVPILYFFLVLAFHNKKRARRADGVGAGGYGDLVPQLDVAVGLLEPIQ
jgi:hypothetical protein